MKRSWLKGLGWTPGGLFLAALLSSPAWGSIPPQPGTVNYVEGQAAIGSQTLGANSAGKVTLAAGQTLSTENGRAEVLLAPGIIVRTGDHSSLQMVSAALGNTSLMLQKGRALVEVDRPLPNNAVRIGEDNSSVQLLKPGLYEFDADHGQVRVFDGEALVEMGNRRMDLKSGHQIALNTGKLKAVKFDKQAYVDDFYRWASLRSSYLAQANVDTARMYAGGSGWAPGVWYGDGWYWDPWYGAYTFIPADGIFYDPFGWGFYSPWLAFEAPYFGFGYGFGYGGGYFHHFGPGYHAPQMAGNHSAGFVGRAHAVGGGMHGVAGNGFAAGSLRSGGFRSGGFAGGGFGGGFRGGAGGFGGGGGRR